MQSNNCSFGADDSYAERKTELIQREQQQFRKSLEQALRDTMILHDIDKKEGK
jgi:hypothetical protein